MLDHIKKPLCRWTVGPTHSRGIEILCKSVLNFRKLYPEFDLTICYNQLDENKISYINQSLKQININFYRQTGLEINIAPIVGDAWNGPCWKLYPPRLRIDSHELILDNDVILYERLSEIDMFLQNSNKFLVLAAKYRNYGQFDHLVGDLKINSGLYGLPPKYDLESKIYQMSTDKWLIRGDDQGILAANLQKEDLIVVDMQSLLPLDDKHNYFVSGIKGAHFIHANTADVHIAWQLYENYCNNYSGPTLQRG